MDFLPDSWAPVFTLETAPLELLVRGTVLYFGILIFMRFMPRRAAGELATMDLVFLLLVVDAAAKALGNYSSVADSLVLIGILMCWDYLLNFLSFHVGFIERLVSASSIQVIRDGELLRRNMRKEFLTEEELVEELREQGIDSIKEVKAAYVDGKGKIAVVCNNSRESRMHHRGGAAR